MTKRGVFPWEKCCQCGNEFEEGEKLLSVQLLINKFYPTQGYMCEKCTKDLEGDGWRWFGGYAKQEALGEMG